MSELQIRPATAEDCPLILEFILELATYEKLRHECVVTVPLLKESLFTDQPKVFCVLAEYGGKPAGFALYFFNFSTFLGRHGLYLEDLFVRPEFRGLGIGKSLLLHLAKVCREQGLGRFEWSVLDWNEPAIEFYRSLGAMPMDEWTVFRLNQEALQQLPPISSVS